MCIISSFTMRPALCTYMPAGSPGSLRPARGASNSAELPSPSLALRPAGSDTNTTVQRELQEAEALRAQLTTL